MKLLANLLFILAASTIARADLVIVQKVEGVSMPGAQGPSEVTITMKGTHAKVDSGTQATIIMDGQTGEVVTLLHPQKQIIRISAERSKAMAEMISKSQAGEKQSKLVATGKKEVIDGVETEAYSADTAQGKATYWIAKNYPQGAEILKQMQSLQPGPWKLANTGMPDFRDFPGLPLKTVLDIGGTVITSTLVSAKLDPVPDSAFAVPTDYSEMKMPKMLDKAKESPPPPAVPRTSP